MHQMIVVDVNVLLSAFIKDSITREILVNSGLEFCFPELSLQKIRKYKNLIKEKSGLTEEEFTLLLHMLLKCITLIPLEATQEHWQSAMEIMHHINPEDVVFIATALAREALVWTDDKHFLQQSQVKTVTTAQLISLLKP
jgi:predicted nucleic acid-binding protein